jgi:hypothetical protein
MIFLKILSCSPNISLADESHWWRPQSTCNVVVGKVINQGITKLNIAIVWLSRLPVQTIHSQVVSIEIPNIFPCKIIGVLATHKLAVNSDGRIEI